MVRFAVRVLSLGVFVLIFTAMTARGISQDGASERKADGKPRNEPGKEEGEPPAPVPYRKNSALKMRIKVEVEIAGTLSVTDKASTVTFKTQVAQLRKQAGIGYQWTWGDVTHVWNLELDDNSKIAAKALHGQQVVVAGMCSVLVSDGPHAAVTVNDLLGIDGVVVVVQSLRESKK